MRSMTNGRRRWQSGFRSGGLPWFSLAYQDDPALHHEHDGHPNELGLEVIAELMFQWLTKHIPLP